MRFQCCSSTLLLCKKEKNPERPDLFCTPHPDFGTISGMNTTLVWIVGGLLAYVLGSVPFGFLFAKTQGKDIRTLGSGNIGATNVFRSVSKTLGLLTFLLDFLKGLAGVLLVPRIAMLVCGGSFNGAIPEYLDLLCGILTVAGHNWTCFLGFKGGKGVATSAGMLLGLTPIGVGIAFAVWVVLFVFSRYVSVASIGAALTMAIVVWPLMRGKPGYPVTPAVLTALAALTIWKHRSNIKRLINGTENRFNFKRK